VFEETSFRDLIGRGRAGDARAAEELLSSKDPDLRVVIRRRLTDPVPRRLVDPAG
jgi:hypothetical protein